MARISDIKPRYSVSIQIHDPHNEQVGAIKMWEFPTQEEAEEKVKFFCELVRPYLPHSHFNTHNPLIG